MIYGSFNYLNPISDNFLTGDNIYLRELQNFFFQTLGMMSITHYGGIGDGRTDNYGPLQVAIDDAHRRGLCYIYVPFGRYIYAGKLLHLEGVTFVGNPHAKIINIRTGKEIEVKQFGVGCCQRKDCQELMYITNRLLNIISTQVVSQPEVKVQMKINIRENSIDSFYPICGTHFDTNSNMSFGIDSVNGWWTVVKGAVNNSGIIPDTYQDYEVEFYVGGTEQYLMIDGTKIITQSSDFTETGNTNIWLFERNASNLEKIKSAPIRMYYCKIYVGDNLVRDFIPARKKSDGFVSLFDKVSGRFFDNIGIGEFLAGDSTNPLGGE